MDESKYPFCLKIINVLMQFIRFGIVGMSNTAISLIIYYIFVFIDTKLYFIGNIVGFLISTLNAYFWNNRFVFKDRKNVNGDGKMCISKKVVAKTYVSYGMSLLLGTLLLYVQVGILGIDVKVAPLLNLFVTIPLNFVLNKFWVFKRV